jgi:ferredoxin-NADP reductase
MADQYPYNGRISRWEEIADGLAIVAVEAPEDPFPFEPGQYATLGLVGPEGKLIQRPMSISSSPDDTSEYEFFIRLVQGGGFTPLLWEHRQVGEPINIKGAKGKFLLQDDGRTCFFVATGTGLAPFMSMLDTMQLRNQPRDVVLLHGVSYDHDLAWRDELQQLQTGTFPLRYAATVSRPRECPDWRGLTGRAEAVLEGQLDEHGLTPDNTTLYLCGNPEMITTIEEMALARGFPPEQIRKELYWPKGRAH